MKKGAEDMKSFITRLLVLGCSLLALDATYSPAKSQASDLTILRITPTGDTVRTNNRQIVIKFNKAIKAIGDFAVNEEVPVRISPQLDCAWRWLDTTSLACQLQREDKLKLATKYTVSVAKGLQSLSGATLTESVEHHFVTLRPSVQRVKLEEWVEAKRPIAHIEFNQAVTAESVLESIKFIGSHNGFISSITLPEDQNPLSDEVYLNFDDTLGYSRFPRLYYVDSDPNQQAELRKRTNAKKQARRIWRVALAADLPSATEIRVGVFGNLYGVEGQESGVKNAKIHQFTSLPTFEFKGIECIAGTSNKTLTLSDKQISRVNLNRKNSAGANKGEDKCDPMERVALKFTLPVSAKSLANTLTLTNTDNLDETTDLEADGLWSKSSNEYRVKSFLRNRFNYGSNDLFRLTVPTVLQANKEYQLLSDKSFEDFFGHPLSNQVNAKFYTSNRKPSLFLNHYHSVLESNIDSELPVYITNLDSLMVKNYRVTTSTDGQGGFDFSRVLPEVPNTSYRSPVGVRSLLGGKSGIIAGVLSSEPASTRWSTNSGSRFVSQVTPFHVHAKLGHFESLVWITDLTTGEPVKNAKVSIKLENLFNLSPLKPDLANAVSNNKGIARLPGLKDIDPSLDHIYEYRNDKPNWIVKVQKDDSVAFLPIMGEYRASTQIWPYLRAKGGYLRSWGTTSQGVYRAGDQIEFKLYARAPNNQHWSKPPQGQYDVSVIDPKGQALAEYKDIKLNEFGAYSNKFSTVKTSPIGWYEVRLKFKNQHTSLSLSPIRVLVSDFTPSPFRTGSELNADSYNLGDTVKVANNARMHAGGPYANAPTRVTARLNPKTFSTDHPEAKGFRFTHQRNSSQTLFQDQGSLDKNGEWKTEFLIANTEAQYGKISVETAVRDDRGKFVAATSGADFFGRDRFLGLKQSKWVEEVGKDAEVEFLVVDRVGKPVANADVKFSIEHQVTKAARVKGAGNAYLTQYTQEWAPLSECNEVSGKKAKVCKFTPTQPGYHRITAKSTDTKSRAVSNTLYTWAVGEGAVLWDQGNSNTIEIIADKSNYKSGETAKFLVKNPFPDAQALITVERYGVVRSWQQKLKGNTPIIKVPITSDDYPGFYLSIVVASPRVDMPIEDGQVDLGKPSFKMGYLKVDVVDGRKQIEVNVKTQRQVYKPRDNVEVTVKAKPETRFTKSEDKRMELAVAVIDEAVFDLNVKGMAYYDPYQGFNRLDNLGVANYNLLMKLIGRQKFEKKGANPGGGGFGATGPEMRSMDKFVAYWNPSIILDSKGRAKFDFDLPDNLTGWRVVAMVVDKEARMGVGSHSFKVNQPTELRPVMPNQLTATDVVDAGFSVMNRTNKSRKIKVDLRASGSALDAGIAETKTVELEPFERKIVWLSLTASNPGEMVLFAKAEDVAGSRYRDSDAIEHKIPVNPRYVLQTQVNYGSTDTNSVIEPIKFPQGIVSGKGGLQVAISSSVIGNIRGAFKYMRNYPYACWEQRLSKGIAASQYQVLKKHLAAKSDAVDWPASQGLPQLTLDVAAQFQASNGGMTYWINRDDYVSPYLSAYTAMAFVWMREQGYNVPQQVETKLHKYLLAYLRKGVTQQSFKSQLSTRVLALTALAKSKQLGWDEVERYMPHVADMDIFAQSYLLMASIAVNAKRDIPLKLSDAILDQAVQSAGKFHFQNSNSHYPSSLGSVMRSNCAALSGLMQASTISVEMRERLGDLPYKIVRAITQNRGARDHWENTQENVFCMNALADYSEQYESIDPNFEIAATFSSADNNAPISLGAVSFDSLDSASYALESNSVTPAPELTGTVNLSKEGEGRYYYRVSASFAKNDDEARPVNAGIEVYREYSVKRDGKWQLVSSPISLERGELVKVDLFVLTSGPKNFVVVDDPIPAGLEPVNRDLATASVIDSESILKSDKRSRIHLYDRVQQFGRYGSGFYHKELRHDSARFYSDYLSAGNHHLSYTAQVIASGDFAVKPLKVEEMYDPDVFGLGLPGRLKIAHENLLQED